MKKKRSLISRMFMFVMAMAFVFSLPVTGFANVALEEIEATYGDVVEVGDYKIMLHRESDFQEYLDNQQRSPSTRAGVSNYIHITVSGNNTYAKVNFWNIGIDTLDSLTGSINLYDDGGMNVARAPVSETRIFPQTYRSYKVYPLTSTYSGGVISIVVRDGSDVGSATFYF
ncbi:hypothetical protein LJB89_03640 [Tyzzerella sp. OttesenSCG-928-J15]|nr:hypothetical protein [Tyzzerella sp. OttesenSCG-928-J15]